MHKKVFSNEHYYGGVHDAYPKENEIIVLDKENTDTDTSPI